VHRTTEITLLADSPQHRTWVLLLSLALCSAGAGCTHVAAYDRARLAHPSMTESYESAMSSHVRAVHEGASGGGSVAESGCGCN
jgi:Domain of unknown function (DUF4266)